MKTLPGILLIAVVGMVVLGHGRANGTGPNRKGSAMSSIQYLANYEKKGLTLVITVNDVVLERWESPARQQSGGPLNMWLRPGPNRIRLRGQVAEGATPRVDLTIVAASSDGSAAQRSVAHLSWPPANTQPKTINEQLTFVPDPVPSSDLWGKAQPITLDAVSRAAILATVSQLHQAATQKNLDRMMALTEFQAVDTGRSLDMPAEKARSSGRDFLADGMQGKWSVEPWEPQKAELNLVEDGLLAAVTVGGKPPIRIQMAEARFEIPVFVAHVDGKWIIAR